MRKCRRCSINLVATIVNTKASPQFLPLSLQRMLIGCVILSWKQFGREFLKMGLWEFRPEFLAVRLSFKVNHHFKIQSVMASQQQLKNVELVWRSRGNRGSWISGAIGGCVLSVGANDLASTVMQLSFRALGVDYNLKLADCISTCQVSYLLK